MGKLVLDKLCVGYGKQCLIANISLSVESGEMLAVLGPSGEGKTTILKTIAGLQPAAGGSISIDGEPIMSLPPEQRDVVLIFQKPLLFPYLNVMDNIGFGLRMQGVNKKKARIRIEELVELTGLSGLEQRKIHQLSGGQQQRVALARGLVLRPAVLLLDEPLSNLDPDLRQQMRELINRIREQTKTTMVFVTHDQSEALMLSDKVALLLNKQVLQTGSPQELFYQPQTSEVARFFGCENLLQGKISDNQFSCESLSFALHHPDISRCTAAIRPEHITVQSEATAGTLRATIQHIQFEGSQTKLMVETEIGHLSVLLRSSGHGVGDTIFLTIDGALAHVIPAAKDCIA